MKIAIVGSAASSVALAPYRDPAWEIWACSPSSMGLPRIDVFFELHSMEFMRNNPDEAVFLAWMKTLKKVYLQEKDPSYPNSETFPLKEMIKEHSRFFFASTISYMLAYAISKKPKQIGIWGIDMSNTSEYEHQRMGCQHFIHEAIQRGIDVHIPIQSDLQYPLPLYGFCETDPMWVKLQSRKSEILKVLEAAETNRVEVTHTIASLKGALENLEYVMRTFIQGANDSVEQDRPASPPVPVREPKAA